MAYAWVQRGIFHARPDPLRSPPGRQRGGLCLAGRADAPRLDHRLQGCASFAARKYRGFDGYTYGLHGTPTTRTLEAQLTALHGGVRTVLVPSGQAAVTMVMLAVLMPGDRVLIPDHVYPPVRSFCEDYLKPRGIDYGVYDPLIGPASPI